jgi:antitoxin component YwqK of YwqJK toxin-antitoxin module
MVRKNDIWKFSEDEWKVHVTDSELLEKVKIKFNLKDSTTIYYENGSFDEETSWDIVVPDNKISKVKQFIKVNS